MTDVVKPVSTLRIVFAAVLDSLTVLFVGGYVISYATGSTATLGEVHLEGIPALILFAVIIVYFVVGSKYLGGTIWQRILGTRRIGGGSSTPSLPTENTAHQLAAKENTSGQGAAAIIPPELDHWNWGAFLLNWVWGIGNNTFIALLMFVPGVNIVMLFVLGVNGSAWAWRNKRWEDVDHFKRIQRKWAIWGVVVWVTVIPAFVAAVFFSVMASLKNSEAYELAVTRLRANTEAINALGTPISTGYPWGSIETSGTKGKADLSFSAEGPKSKGTVYLDATKDFGTWKINRLELEITGRVGRINLADDASRKSFEDGLAAAKSGDFVIALRLWRPLADQGVAAAQFNVGVMYDKGQGVPQSDAEALTWYRKAADQGHAAAQLNLGVMYENGQGVPRDYAEALKWYRKAADQGRDVAQNNLGFMYANGQGVPKNDAEAVKLYRLAADQGLALAQANLGLMYREGQGVPQSYAEAVKWYRLAADQGAAAAQLNLGLIYYNGRGVPQDYAEAVTWYRKAAGQGHAIAQYSLGVMYDQGQGVPQNYAEALTWYRKAADQGHSVAQNNLGFMYNNGQGVPQDYAEAIKWYRLAADQGHANAQTNLGTMYDNGRGMPQNYVEAAKWYRLAADQGQALAQLNLGFLYDNGRGVSQSDAEALKWYRLAADQGHATAQHNLGVMYASGQGVPQDHVLAHMWFNLSATQSNQRSVKNRDDIARRMTPAQIADAEKLAREWKPTTQPPR